MIIYNNLDNTIFLIFNSKEVFSMLSLQFFYPKVWWFLQDIKLHLNTTLNTYLSYEFLQYLRREKIFFLE